MNNTSKCPGCLGEFLMGKGKSPPHPYIGASPECWGGYSEILAKEFNDPEYFKVHRITVDSYAAQHIGDQNDRRARQSANLHIIALYLYYEKKADTAETINFLKNATAQKLDWPAIKQLTQPNWLTVNDIIKAQNPTEHAHACIKWGQSVWEAYTDCHKDLIETYNKFRYS